MPKFLISDCDYTLVDFNHEGGIKALRSNSDYEALADPFDNYFKTILEGTRTAGNPHFSQLQSIFEELSNTIVSGKAKLSDAVWSRELWAYHSLNNVSESDRAKQSQEVADIYWRGVGKTSSIYEDTPLFLERLRQNKFYVILVSSSDGRLVLNKEKTGFKYIPSEAKKLKTERYKLCGFGKLVDLDKDLYIGDPISKPHQIFWEETLRDSGIDTTATDNHIVVMGDSHDTDLKGSTWFKSQTILIDRKNKYSSVEELPDADFITHDLKEALGHIL